MTKVEYEVTTPINGADIILCTRATIGKALAFVEFRQNENPHNAYEVVKVTRKTVASFPVRGEGYANTVGS